MWLEYNWMWDQIKSKSTDRIDSWCDVYQFSNDNIEVHFAGMMEANDWEHLTKINLWKISFVVSLPPNGEPWTDNKETQ